MTKVEEVARALAARQLDEGDGFYDWFALTEEITDHYLDLARAAIEAMRVPTSRMKMTSQHVFMNPDKNYTFQGSDWDRIIDAALSHEGK